jgi:hypothetical protein
LYFVGPFVETVRRLSNVLTLLVDDIGPSAEQNFLWECDGDGGLIEMAFSKKKVEDRKQWLRSFVPVRSAARLRGFSSERGPVVRKSGGRTTTLAAPLVFRAVCVCA